MIDNWKYYLYINDLDEDHKIHSEITDIQYGSLSDLSISLFTGLKTQLLAKYISNLDCGYEVYCGREYLEVIDKVTKIKFRFSNNDSRMLIDYPNCSSYNVSAAIAAYNFGHINFILHEIIRLYKRHKPKSKLDKASILKTNMSILEKAEQNMFDCFKIDRNAFNKNKYNWV